MLFVWMMAKAGSTVPNQPPERFAQTVALDIGQALDRAPMDVEQYVRQEYAKDSQPFLVTLTDGRSLEMGASFPEAMKADGRARLEMLRNLDPARLGRGGPFGRGGAFRQPGGDGSPDDRGPRPYSTDQPRPGPPSGPLSGALPDPDSRQPFDGPRPPFDGMGRFPPDLAPGDRGPGFGRGGQPFRPRPALIIAGGRVVGLVVVPAQPPFTFLLTRYAPSLITVAVATLVVGGILAAFVVFGPARRRLKGVEEAARRLGAGDLHARAPVTGSDEVTAVASAFNAMAEELASRTEALVEADRVRRQLLADVSHELNTPVTAMRGYLETLSMPELSLDDATRAKYLAIVGDETARLERLIGDLLDLARLEGGGGVLQIAPLQVRDLLERVVARHEQSAQRAGVRLDVGVEPGGDVVAVDRTRFEQALQNLAANALRYAPAGTSVRLHASNENGTVTIRISDAGPGIPAEHLLRVFDRFYKGDSSRAVHASESGGSGLGLSIVKAIVERHGARISVTSKPGETVFTIAGVPTRAGVEPVLASR
ncbi:MAG: HAMP domain-containing sensor histidine kinase, partial [Vicinamibacterales bacterium]